MALTRNFRETVVERVNRDPGFARALLDEASKLLLSGEATHRYGTIFSGWTSSAMRAPEVCSASWSSYSCCRLSQNSAVVPNSLDRRNLSLV